MTKVARAAYTIVGLALVGIGFVGYGVPGMPSTIFMIMALFCFKKGSPRFENWLLQHKWFGPTLRDWDENRSIKPRIKVAAVVTMWAFIGVSALLIHRTWVLALVASLGAFGTWYILTRKSVPAPLPEGHGTAIN